MADYIGTGFPQFSCALVQMRYSIGENSDSSHILKGEGGGLWREDYEGKGKREERRKGEMGVGICKKQ